MNKTVIDWDTRMDVSKSLVTVVTPTYHRIDLLVKAVTSVMKQRYSHIEHIVVGDRCPVLDDGREKLLKINPDLRIYNLPDAPGFTYGPARIARVRNTGISEAKGEFIAHLDDDNTWDNDHVQTLIECFRRRPDAAAAHSYRKLLIDGIQPYRYPYHPWSPDIKTAKHVYDTYNRMGIYQTGSHLMRDRVTFHEERDCTLDTNELMVRRRVHEVYPFTEQFSEAMIESESGEDDVFCETIYRAGYRFVASGRYSLNFRVGGRFTKEVLSKVSDTKDND